MHAVPLDSSVIAGVRFVAETNILEVDFHSGRTYRYFMVPRAVFENLIAAESAGRYFNEEIKGRFGWERVR